MSPSRIEIPRRQYPQTWWLLDVIEDELRLLGGEVVDLSPGAIELRHASRELRAWSDLPENWLAAGPASPLAGLTGRHRHALSFGPRLEYLVERDGSGALNDGRPFRHLRIRHPVRTLTPATAAEIGYYFFGRRPAGFAFLSAGTAHGFIGLDWERVGSRDLERLVRREMESGEEE
ncbi:MAG: hypothetical protein RRA92_06430 [Gemmatimonadota bacterium]|nr:hypothetical protein [Gemmatimonadota bacterium]